VRQPFEKRQLDRQPLQQRQRLERFLQPFGALGRQRHPLRPVRGIGDQPERLVRIAGRRRHRPPRPDPVDRPAARHHQQPRDHRAARPVVTRRLLPRLREDVLDHLLRFERLGQDAQRQRIGHPRMPIVQGGQRLAVAGRHAAHRFQIRAVAGILLRPHPHDRPQQPHHAGGLMGVYGPGRLGGWASRRGGSGGRDASVAEAARSEDGR
jgi:hypothetical protein